MRRIIFWMLTLILVSVSIVHAGVYLGTADCFDNRDCAPRSFVSDPANTVPPFAVAHPPGYDGSGGLLTVTVCVIEGSERLRGPVRRAIATWNALEPTVENCRECKVWEDMPPTTMVFHAETAALHELGHCPLGLQHPDRNWDAANDGFWEPTSFTRSWDVANPAAGGIQVGMDFVRGTLDDIQQAGGGQPPESVHWFRIADNNPFVVDSTVIDIDTFSRSITSNLPAGHSWAANANRRGGEELGIQNTQAVMYALQSPGEVKTTLTADDVNMIKMALTGVDWDAGTADDIQLDLVFAESCTDVDVLITFGQTQNEETLGQCMTGLDFSFPQNPLLARHINVVAPSPTEPLVIIFNQDLDWATGDCPTDPLNTGCLFTDGFESGSLMRWSVAP